MGHLINTVINLQDRFSPTLTIITGNTTKFSKQLRSANASAKGLQKTLKGVASAAAGFAKTTAKIGIGIAAVGGGVALKSSIDTFKDFQQSMAQTAGTAGINQLSADYKKMENAAREAGKATTKTAAEAAQALGYMSLAGWSVNDSVNGLTPILRLSEATQAALATTSDLVTDSMSALGVKVGENGKGLTEYLDILTKANNKSNQTASQLMEAYIGVGGQFNNLNTPLSESAALLGVLANRGIKASEGGNSLSAILINLTKKSGESAEAMKALGLNAYDSQGKFKGVTNVLKELNEKTKQLTPEMRNNYLTMIGGKTQISTLNALMSGLNTTNAEGVSELDALTKELNNAGGSLEEMAAVVNNTMSGAFSRLSSAISDMKIEIGKALDPILTPFIDALALKIPLATEKMGKGLKKITTIVTNFRDVFDGTTMVATGAKEISKATGISHAKLMKLMFALKDLQKRLKKVAKEFTIFKKLLSGKLDIFEYNRMRGKLSRMTGMTWKEIDTLVELLRNKMDMVKSLLSSVVTVGFQAVGKAFQFLKEHADLIVPVLSGIAGGLGAFIILPQIVSKIRNLAKVLLTVGKAMKEAGSIFKGLAAVFALNPFTIAAVAIGVFVGVFVLAYTKCETFRTTVNALVGKFKDFAVGIGVTVIAKLQELAAWFQEKIQPQLSKLGTNLLSLWTNILQPIASFMTVVFAGAFAAAFTYISGAISTAIGVIQGLIEGLLMILNGVIEFIVGVFTKDWEMAWQGVKDIFSGLWEGIKTIALGVLNSIIDRINAITSGINTVASKFSNFPGFGWAGKINIPQIPHFAMGTQYFQGGLAQINERGGEIVSLPNGSKVIPADRSKELIKNAFSNTSKVYNLQNSNIGTTENHQTTIQRKQETPPITINVYGTNKNDKEIGETIAKQLRLVLMNM